MRKRKLERRTRIFCISLNLTAATSSVFFSLRAFCKRFLKLPQAQLWIGTLVSLVVVIFIDCVDFVFRCSGARVRQRAAFTRRGLCLSFGTTQAWGPRTCNQGRKCIRRLREGNGKEKARSAGKDRACKCIFYNTKKKHPRLFLFNKKRRRTVGSVLQRKTTTACGEIAGRTSSARALFAGVLGLDFLGAALAIGAASANISCGDRGAKWEGRTFFSSKMKKKTTRSKKARQKQRDPE